MSRSKIQPVSYINSLFRRRLTHSNLRPAASLPLRECEPCVQITWLSGIDRRAHPFGTVPIFPSSAPLTQSHGVQHKNRPPQPGTTPHTLIAFFPPIFCIKLQLAWARASRGLSPDTSSGSLDVDSLVCEAREGNLRLATVVLIKYNHAKGACKVAALPRANAGRGD